MLNSESKTHRSRLLAEFLHALFPGNCLARTLAGAGVGTRPLAAGRKRPAVAVATIAADVAQPGDVLLDLATQRAFHRILPVDDADNLGQLLFAQLLGPALRINAGFLEDRPAVGSADAVDIRQTDPDRLVVWNVNA